MTFDYTADWFTNHIPAWQSFFNQIGWSSATSKTIIEIGSFEGRSSLWILENLIQNPESRLHCVDVFPQEKDYTKRFDHNISLSGKREQAVKHAMTSYAFLTRYAADRNKADFIYIDGSHRASDVLADLVLSFRILRVGGLIICDDYLGGSPDASGVLNSPKIAVDAFTTIHRDQIQIFSPQPLYQLAFIKTSEKTSDDPTSRGETPTPG